MSKIYEALLRAEMDRLEQANVVNPPTVQALPKPAQTAAQLPVADVSAPLSLPAALSLHKEPAKEEDPLKVPSAVALEQVSVRSWNLSVGQLPAIEERGKEVEQFRSLRTRMYQFRGLNKLKSVLVSSGLPAEGKSFIAVNLAISFARHKSSRVLLIDGDMRRGTLHKLLGTSNKPGLTEYLSGNATLAQVVQRAEVKKDGSPLPNGITSLDFIPCGADAENAADLSGNTRFAQLIAAVYPLYEWIVVDSSPVNLVADGVNLARNCDGVLLVTRSAVTKFPTAQRALSELKASKVVGVVLNAVVNPPASEGYYGYDNYDKIKT